MYSDGEYLKLNNRVGITKEVYDILKKEKKRLFKEEKRRISMAKIVCNLVIKNYGQRNLQAKSPRTHGGTERHSEEDTS